MNIKHFFFFLLYFSIAAQIYPQSTPSIFSLDNIISTDKTEKHLSFESLFTSYISDSIDMQKIELEVKKASLELEKSYLKASPNLNLSTGSMSANFSKNKQVYSASPEATITLPSIANAEIKAEAPVSVTVKENSSSVSWSGAGVSLSADIISSAKKSKDVAIQKSLRTLLEAKRKLEKEKLTEKKQFLNDIKTLYTKASALISAQDTLYDKELNMQQLNAQGYAQTSSTYRTAAINANNAKHDVLVKQREYSTALHSFSKKCGITLNSLPENIPDEELVDINSFNKEKYADIESSTWIHKHNTDARNAETDFTLKANAGYKYRDDNHNVTTGITATYKGLNMGAGVTVPVNKPDNPSLSLSLGWDLNTGRTASIDKKEEAVDIENELLSIRASEEAYDEKIQEYMLKREDLLWAKNQNATDVKMYSDFLNETNAWYKKGIIPLSQLNSAQRNYTNAVVTEMTGRIDRLIYNIDANLLFVQDVEE